MTMHRRVAHASNPGDPKRFLKTQARAASRRLRCASGFALAGGLLLIVAAWLLARLVNGVVFPAALPLPMVPVLVALLVVYALRAYCSYRAEYDGARAALEVKADLRGRLLQQMLQHPAQTESGALISRMVEGLDALHGYYARYLPAMSSTVLLPFAILCFVFPVDWVSGLVMLVTAPLIPIFMILIGQGAEQLNQRQWRTLARAGGYLFDRIQGMTTLKLFNATQREAAVLQQMGETYRIETMAVLRVAFLSALALEFFATVSIAVVAVLVGFRLLWGQAVFSHAYFVLLLAPEFYLPLRRMGAHYHARMEAIGAVEQLMPMLAREGLEEAKPMAAAPRRSCRVRFEEVSAAYLPGQPVLERVSFDLAAGEQLALVGASGSGKSTMLALLLGLMEPSEGRILIDDTPLADIDREAWWRAIGWVPQRAHLAYGEVARTMLSGNPSLEATQRDALMQALGIDFSAQQAGELGRGISGGQVQRVAVARALARQAPLLLMDEPTASLDLASERQVMAAIAQHRDGATVIAAAHRLPTVRGYEQILVLSRGRQVALGTHEMLLRDSTDYRDALTLMEAVCVAR